MTRGIDHAETLVESIVGELGERRREDVLAVFEIVVRDAQLSEQSGAEIDLGSIFVHRTGGGRKCPASPDHGNPVAQRLVIDQ